MTDLACGQTIEDGHRKATHAELVAANINPQTGLATDYLNHFNEAIMLLDMIPDMPDCVQDFLAWRPVSYPEHFRGSHFAARNLAISAYEQADPALRVPFDALTATMTAVLVEIGQTMRAMPQESQRAVLARETADRLRPMVVRAGTLINGVAAAESCADTDAILASAQ